MIQLNLIEKPSKEIISLEETKNYLRIDHDFDDVLILNLIKSTREAVESIIQKSIVKQTWEYVLTSSSIWEQGFYGDDYPSVFGDTMRIPLPKPPIIKVVSVTVGEDELEKRRYSIERMDSKFCLHIKDKKLFNRRNRTVIKIKYEAGIADNVENIPYQLKLANLMLVATAYQERFSYGQSGLISKGVKQLLSPFLNLRFF
ncbi:MAG: head-tail connector protein [Holosporaceae bacterium]|jgi:uncharacterized phiE125 gp8 family phage protein|nr:head-tail connector protein [Holosporaceae bacterium]